MGSIRWATVRAFGDLRGKTLYSVHNSTFDMAFHRWQAPLAELAARVGYSDGANFANRFRRLTGQTPGAFRRLGRKPFAREVQTL